MIQKLQQGGKRLTIKAEIAKKPKISIITVVYNSAQYLEETIQSVLKQSYKDYEYIIVDGGSTDGTIKIIEKYQDRIEYWISESDCGIYDAMNKGIKLAKGEIIGILNSGDFYAVSALAEVANLIKKNQDKQYLVITGAMYRFDLQTKIKFKQVRTEKDLHKNINLGMPINHPATFLTKNIYEQFGYFNPDFKICGDHDLFFRIYHNQLVKFIFTDRVLASMSMGGISETFDSLWLRAKEKIAIRRHKINYLTNVFLSFQLIFVGCIKYVSVAIIGQRAVSIKHLLVGSK